MPTSSPCVRIIQSITAKVLKDGLPKGVCLNVNFPLAEKFQGVKICRMAHGTWGSEVTKCHHPRGYDYWWMVGHYQNDEPEAEDTDNWALTTAMWPSPPLRSTSLPTKPSTSSTPGIKNRKPLLNMKYYLIAGEASGDLHASRLMRSLKKLTTRLSSVSLAAT